MILKAQKITGCSVAWLARLVRDQEVVGSNPTIPRFFVLLTVFLSLLVFTTPLVAAEKSPKVEIFVTAWCPYCRHLESFLKENGIEYTRYDIEKDERGARIYEEIGGAGVPVSRIGKKIVHGYDPDAIQTALKSRA